MWFPLAVILGSCLLFVYLKIPAIKLLTQTSFSYGEIKHQKQLKQPEDHDLSQLSKTKVHFVGDVMLARHVEHLMTLHGINYPYTYIDWFNPKDSFLVGNFEASVPAKHVKTPNFTFNFSVNKQYLPGLKTAGFTHLSLANNHALDYGMVGLKNTELVLADNDFVSFGHPINLSTSSVSFIDLNSTKLALIGVSTLSGEPTDTKIKEVLSWAKVASDLQIVYIHWGNEYELKQSNRQRILATKLAEAGADLIIGHHPHVTQGIEKINETLVFYSLGNFIFDQYFEVAVREGLFLTLEEGGEENDFTLAIIPITTRNTLAQPQLMLEENKLVFLKNLAGRSSQELAGDITNGKITLTLPLATSTEMVIMAE